MSDSSATRSETRGSEAGENRHSSQNQIDASSKLYEQVASSLRQPQRTQTENDGGNSAKSDSGQGDNGRPESGTLNSVISGSADRDHGKLDAAVASLPSLSIDGVDKRPGGDGKEPGTNPPASETPGSSELQSPGSGPKSTPETTLKQMLDDSGGARVITFGDYNHDASGAGDKTVQLVQQMAAAGITHLALESVPISEQSTLNDYVALRQKMKLDSQKTDKKDYDKDADSLSKAKEKLYADLSAYAKNFGGDMKETLAKTMNLIDAAADNGLHVLAIDADNPSDTSHSRDPRDTTMADTIEKTLKKDRDSKIAVFAGLTHFRNGSPSPDSVSSYLDRDGFKSVSVNFTGADFKYDNSYNLDTKTREKIYSQVARTAERIEQEADAAGRAKREFTVKIDPLDYYIHLPEGN